MINKAPINPNLSLKILSMLAKKDNHQKSQNHYDVQLEEQEQEEAQRLFQEIQGIQDVEISRKKQEEDEDEDAEQMEAEEQEIIIKDKIKKQQDQDSSQKQQSQQQQNNNNNNLETKIKSILKNTYKNSIPTPKKSVSFLQKPPSNTSPIVLESTRKWNQKLKNPKKGKFDPFQKRTLIQSLSRCLAAQNLSYDDVVRAMSQDYGQGDNNDKIPRNLHLWTKVCSVLPDRSLVSSYKFLKRELSTKNKGGQWKEEQVQRLEQLVRKYGRKWSMIAKQMHRTPQNIRDKYRAIGQQNSNSTKQQTIWKFTQLYTFLTYLQKYSKKQFLISQIQNQLQKAQTHDQAEQKQQSQRKYNSKNFIFHNNQIVRKYINKQFNRIKVQQINWQKIADKIGTKTIFDCRNKFIQLLQLELYGMDSKQYYQKQITKFITKQNPKTQNDINWTKWNTQDQEIQVEQAKNRWMILKRHVQGRGQKSFGELLQILRTKFKLK